jgi:hypothetical protein
VKRRDFIIQSVSASAVIMGAGYASFDIFFRRNGRYQPAIEQRAAKAAMKVTDALDPIADEGAVGSESASLASAYPQEPKYSRPAISYAEQKAETLMPDSVQPFEMKADTSPAELIEEVVLTEADKEAARNASLAVPKESATSVQEKIANFEADFTDDVLLKEEEYRMLVQTLERINKVQDYVGYGNFNVLSFDDALKYADYTARIGSFTKEEKDFLDLLFHYDSSQLGFFGEKVVSKQTNVIADKDIVKMPGTGHYVYRGHSEEFYKKVRKEVGESLILTSGIRNIMKQYQLFMAKTVHASGNLSRASRSLAPPGHSYHAVGDFDVGQVGAGLNNFTAEFARTDEFKRLQDLGYVRIRYTANNNLGVRYEPWHIRVV